METVPEQRRVGQLGRVLVSPECRNLINADWFRPGFWGERAVPVTTGGRGSSWFVDTPAGKVVLRQYRRGGLIAKLSEEAYFFTGYERTRAFAEFRLLRTLFYLGLPVPEPLAAMVLRYKLFSYKAWIVIRRIPGAKPLPEAANLEDAGLWRRVGRVIRRFHDAGVNHVDLNCDNILVSPERINLIDFDKCKIMESDPVSGGWKSDNLERLKRSVHKRCAGLGRAQVARLWSALIESYKVVE